MKQNILIDTDMGYDDIMTICLLLANKTISIIGIIVNSGVADKQYGIRNMKLIQSYIGTSIPIYDSGNTIANSPVKFPQEDIDRANNLTLLKNLPLERLRPSISQAKPFSQCLFDLNNYEAVTLLCLGPLSNIPLILSQQSTCKNISQVIIMGGAVDVPGNVPPDLQSEYNFAIDPKATQQVLSYCMSIILIPMDATLYAPAKISKPPTTKLSQKTNDFLKKVIRLDQNKLTKTGQIIQSIISNNQNDLCYFYDPVTAFVLLTNPPSYKKIMRKITCNKFGGLKTRSLSSNNQLISIVNWLDTSLFYSFILDSITIKNT